MVPFAGWSMPIKYADSIIDSTTWCRKNASVFDVSHMCGFTLKVRIVGFEHWSLSLAVVLCVGSLRQGTAIVGAGAKRVRLLH